MAVELLLFDHRPDLIQGFDARNVCLVCDRLNSIGSICKALIGVADDLGRIYARLLSRIVQICRLKVLLSDNEFGMVGFGAHSNGLVGGVVPIRLDVDVLNVAMVGSVCSEETLHRANIVHTSRAVVPLLGGVLRFEDVMQLASLLSI